MKKKILLLVFFGLILGNVSFAHEGSAFWTPGIPLVPCGQTTPCDYCQLLHLARHLIDFILIAAAPVLATLFFVIAGFMMMLGGTNPGMLAQGKRIFKDTFIGLLIVMLAWLFTNILVNTLADPGRVGEGTNWYEFSCQALP